MKYIVAVKQITWYTVEIEAPDEDRAVIDAVALAQSGEIGRDVGEDWIPHSVEHTEPGGPTISTMLD